MSKAIFMGRVGVLYPKIEREEDFEEYVFYRDVPKNLSLLGQMGFSLVIVGNAKNDEAGASFRGAFDRVNDSIRHMTSSALVIRTCYHDTEKCDCKIPKPKMFKDIMEEFKFDAEESFAIAGTLPDFNAISKAGLKNILLLTTVKKKWSAKSESISIAKISSFANAVTMIQEMLRLEVSL